jgi:protein TonB
MFNRLPESNAQRQKRSGGFVVSTVVHAGLIALAVKATALTATPAPRVEPLPIFILPAPPVPRVAPTVLRQGGAPANGPAMLPTAAPEPIDFSEIPDVIPEPGAMNRLIDDDGAFRRGRTRLIGGGDATAPNVSDGQPLTEHFVDRPVVAMPGSASPRYPSLLQSAGVEGDVRAQFVVDTLGRVENGSVRILDTTHPSFADAVRDALARARFVPAEAGGRKVRQLVEQPFSFKLNRR